MAASFLTQYGEQIALLGAQSGVTTPPTPLLYTPPVGKLGWGGIARLGTELRLYTDDNTGIDKTTIALTYLPSGNGYAPVSLTPTSWNLVFDGGDLVIRLPDVVWTFTGSTTPITGICLVDSALPPNVLAIWQREDPFTPAASLSLLAKGLTIRVH